MNTNKFLNKKVLVVDDNEEMRVFLISKLNEIGIFNIVEVDNVIHAKEKIIESFNSAEPIDLILCDHHMPNNTGLDLLNFIRMSLKFNGLGYIAVTSDSERSVVLPYIVTGADSFIVKPVNAKDLLAKIKQVAAKRN